jgi:hypothetical protein
MNAAAPPLTLACANCATANPQGAQFCANCGAPFNAAPPPPPRPPAIPRAPLGAAPQAQAMLAMDPAQAMNAALTAITASGATIQGQQPGLIQFEAIKKSFWSTLNIPLRYRGEVTIAPSGPGQSAVRVAAKLDWGSAGGIIAINVICILVLGWVLLPLLLVGLSLWTISSKFSREVAEAVSTRLSAGSAQAAWTPPPAPAPPRPSTRLNEPAPVLTPRAEAADPHEGLRKLKELYDLGAVSEAEFAAKKAELLARL